MRYVEVVRVLLQHTADVNAQSENGYTALLLPDLRREETLSFTGTLGMAARKAWKLLKPCLETW